MVNSSKKSLKTPIALYNREKCGTWDGGTKKSLENDRFLVLGIDPGLEGAFYLLGRSRTGANVATFCSMPVKTYGKEREIDFEEIRVQLRYFYAQFGKFHVYLERAMPMAMGSKHAFNYGRGFAALELALKIESCSVTYVEPNKWGKVMHEGVSADLKPKVRSLKAAERLFPVQFRNLPKNRNGKVGDGPLEALLIAGYGLHQLGASVSAEDDSEEIADF